MTNLRSTLEQALVFHQSGNFAQAEALYRQVLQQLPGQPDALNLLGVMANQLGRHEEAIDLIGKAVARLPYEPDFHGNLAGALDAAGRVSDAIFHYREAVRLKPDSVNYRILLSASLQHQGQLDEALANGLEALRLDPNSPQAYCLLGDHAGLGHYTFTGDDLQRMQQLADQGCPGAILLYFTLGAHWEKTGNYDRAFTCYRRANELKLEVYRKGNRAFDQGKHHALVEALMAVFTPEFMKQVRTFGIDSEAPIFVVGLVRSGTTLVEQILASHPQVHGAGERKDIDQMAIHLHEEMQASEFYPFCARHLEPGMTRSLAYGYLQRLARRAGSASRIVDKMPHNYLHLGLIAMLFPRARIIHCRRNPMDVCTSAYFQNFEAMAHAASLDDIAFHHRMYVKLMEHWQRVLPHPVHEVVYEDMVADQETESRKLVAACGLDWDDRCLTFYRTNRAVQTASKMQVRQPIYRHSVGRWKPFQAHLEPLRLALGLVESGQDTKSGIPNLEQHQTYEPVGQL